MFSFFKPKVVPSPPSPPEDIPSTDEVFVLAINKVHGSENVTKASIERFIGRMQPILITTLYDTQLNKYLPNMCSFNRTFVTKPTDNPYSNTIASQHLLTPLPRHLFQERAFYLSQFVGMGEKDNRVNKLIVMFDDEYMKEPVMSALTGLPTTMVNKMLNSFCTTFGMKLGFIQRLTPTRLIIALLPISPEFTLTGHGLFMDSVRLDSLRYKI